MKDREESLFRRLKISILIWVVFWIIAIMLWLLTGNAFFLFNFGYIGTAVAVGMGAYELLPRKKKPAGRRFAQLLVGVYMLGFLGLIAQENMQIEGFFFYLLGGFFAGSVIHYLVAKIFLPLLFGRGWCGWACWTAMVLDYLPYKRNKSGRIASGWEKIRYIHYYSIFRHRKIIGNAHYWIKRNCNFKHSSNRNNGYFTIATINGLVIRSNRP